MKARKKKARIDERLKDIEVALRFCDVVEIGSGIGIYPPYVTDDPTTEQLLNQKSKLLCERERLERLKIQTFARRRANLRRMESILASNPAVARDPKFIKKLERLRAVYPR